MRYITVIALILSGCASTPQQAAYTDSIQLCRQATAPLAADVYRRVAIDELNRRGENCSGLVQQVDYSSISVGLDAMKTRQVAPVNNNCTYVTRGNVTTQSCW